MFKEASVKELEERDQHYYKIQNKFNLLSFPEMLFSRTNSQNS